MPAPKETYGTVEERHRCVTRLAIAGALAGAAPQASLR
jgi:hypothetical protein